MKYTHPKISARDKNDLEELNMNQDIDNEEYYDGVKGFDKDGCSHDNATRVKKMKHVYALAHKENDPSKEIRKGSKTLKLPMTIVDGVKQQAYVDQVDWQGDKADKPSKTLEIKLELQTAKGDIVVDDEVTHKAQYSYYLMGELALTGGAEKTLNSPEPKKPKSQKNKADKLAARKVAARRVGA